MRYFLSLLLVMASFAGSAILPQPARAWGALGHLTVCDLAYRNFTPTTRAALTDLFQAHSGGVTAGSRHYTSFNVGCLEEDAFPRRHKADHFINVSRDTAALVDDRGGNLIDVTFSGDCGGMSRPDNLHSVWDNCALQAGLFDRVRQRADFKSTWGERTITYRAVDSLNASTTLAQRQAFVQGEPWQWAAESYAITLKPFVRYCVMVGMRCQYSTTNATLAPSDTHRRETIAATYLDSIKDVAQERVQKAGVRLAHLINLALDPAYTGPA